MYSPSLFINVKPIRLLSQGKDMGDGWETKRSRQKGHKDWAIIKL